MQADEAGDEDGVGEVDCAAEAGGWVDPVCCWVRRTKVLFDLVGCNYIVVAW